jgi:conjugative transposon TraM protein
METTPTLEVFDDEIDHRQKNKKYVLVLLAIFVLFLIGLGIYTLNLSVSDKSKEEENALQLDVTKPKSKELEEKKLGGENNTNRLVSQESESNFIAITGNAPVEKTSSNEDLTAEDFDDVKKAKVSNPHTKRQTSKDRENRKLQAQIAVTERQNKRLLREDNQLFRQTREEQEEARREAEDRKLNQRQQALILDNLEKVSNQNYSKPIYADTLKPNPRQNRRSNKTVQESINESAKIAPAVGTNTTGQFWSKQTGFYSLNSKNSKQSYTEKRGILAVVHGDAEGIIVASGQEVKIRLLEPLRIFEGQSAIVIPLGTLLSTVAKIGQDRLFLNINSIYYLGEMHEVNINIFDIDGRAGLNVPSLLGAKDQSRLMNSLSTPIAGGNYFAPSGTIAQQVGSSIAVNLAQNAIQAGSQVIRKKTKIAKVHIRSNYKIILFNSNSNNSNQQDNEEILED